MTPQRDLQLYKNELDVLDHCGVTWEPYTEEILEFTTDLYIWISDMMGEDVDYLFWDCEDACWDQVIHHFKFIHYIPMSSVTRGKNSMLI